MFDPTAHAAAPVPGPLAADGHRLSCSVTAPMASPSHTWVSRQLKRSPRPDGAITGQRRRRAGEWRNRAPQHPARMKQAGHWSENQIAQVAPDFQLIPWPPPMLEKLNTDMQVSERRIRRFARHGGMKEWRHPCGGQRTPSLMQGRSGAGCARNVGYRCPGISTVRSCACTGSICTAPHHTSHVKSSAPAQRSGDVAHAATVGMHGAREGNYTLAGGRESLSDETSSSAEAWLPGWEDWPWWPSSSPWELREEDEEDRLGLMRCSKMAMRRNMETRMAVAAKPKEMALAFVEAPPKPLMEEASSSLTSPPPAADCSDPVASPIHGLDLCPAKPLIRLCLLCSAPLRSLPSMPTDFHRAPLCPAGLLNQSKCSHQRHD
ncbi:hypothetical protein GUJ93_ZPchr0005g15159 [Zizania palustris]|uniref:Uncharacterized protein n=1 Tax=Zizania palustris TaxID=103762 RepID=A0A8J5SM04_ZIZPA|nr:hypothetical protein GUJ93_ZPchr0005g15159 [Zizania palustris]